MSYRGLDGVQGDRLVIGGNVSLGKGRSLVDAPRTHLNPIEAALQQWDEARFGKHDAAASLLCHGSNESRQPQFLSSARRLGPERSGRRDRCRPGIGVGWSNSAARVRSSQARS